MTGKQSKKKIKNVDQLIYTLYFIVTIVVECYSIKMSLMALIPILIFFGFKKKKDFMVFLADGYLVDGLIVIRVIKYFQLNEYIVPFLILITFLTVFMGIYLYRKGVSNFTELKEKKLKGKNNIEI